MMRILPFCKGNKILYNSLSHDPGPVRLYLAGISLAMPGQKAARKYVIFDLKNEFIYHYSNKRLGDRNLVPLGPNQHIAMILKGHVNL